MQTVKKPTVHVTNYQQYVNAEFLQQAIADSIPEHMDASLPENIYISIAYVDIKKMPKNMGKFITYLNVSIKGETFRYNIVHNKEDLYLAKVGLDLNQYSTQATKDAHIRLLQQAFEAIVSMRASRIVDDLIANYVNVK